MLFRIDPRWRHEHWQVSHDVGAAYDSRTWEDIDSPSEYAREVETMADDAGRDL